MYESSKQAKADGFVTLDKVDGVPSDLRNKQSSILIIEDVESLQTVTPPFLRESGLESCLTANAPLNVSGEITAP